MYVRSIYHGNGNIALTLIIYQGSAAEPNPVIANGTTIPPEQWKNINRTATKHSLLQCC